MIKTLYGLDKKGGFKIWTIETDEQGLLTIRHGKEGGKMTVKSEVVKVKNVGRSNQTTPGQQAENEALGRIKKQEDKGYRENKEDLQALPVLPILAGDYNKIGHRIWERGDPVWGSDKLDGVRCMAKKQDGIVVLESRTGQPYTLPHVVEELERVMREGEILDGEIYLHGQALQDITSAVKRTDTQAKIDEARLKLQKLGTQVVGYESKEWLEAKEVYDEAVLIHEIRPQLKFIIFDTVSELEFKFRLVELDKVATRFEDVSSVFIEVIEYYLITDDEHLRNILHPDAVRRGYEGVMLRTSFGLYESGKRSAYLQKYKTFLDSEFVILDIIPDNGDGSRYLVQNDVNGLTFTVTLGNMGERADRLANKHLYIMLPITVRYQTRYKKTLLPQFPTGVVVRNYE